MDSLIVNAIIGFWLVLFGAMAIVPFVLESKPARQTPIEDDVIISIQPVAMMERARHPAGEPAIAADPAHRQAA